MLLWEQVFPTIINYLSFEREGFQGAKKRRCSAALPMILLYSGEGEMLHFADPVTPLQQGVYTAAGDLMGFL